MLLRNEPLGSRRVLPLSDEVHTVALIGPLADDAGRDAGILGCARASEGCSDAEELH